MRYMLLIEKARDLDEVISIAARHVGVRVGRCAIEVRPIRQRLES